MATNSVQAELISTQNERDLSNGLLSQNYVNSNESKLISSVNKNSTDDIDEKKDKVLISDIDKISFDKYIKYETIDEFEVEEILSSLDLRETEEVLNYDYVIKNYTYRSDMQDVYRQINDDAISVIDRYMQKTNFIPVKDSLWFMALGAVELNYSNSSDIICSWPIDINDYKETYDYLLSYNWKTAQSIIGTNGVTRRTGGAIGPFQIESFFGKGVNPVIPEEFGLIGSSESRQDCWVSLGGCTDSGSSIIWQQGTYADRWSIADSANICLGVYDETLRRVNGKCALTELDNKYEQVVYLMWAHNRGTGILNNREYMEKSKKVCTYLDEIIDLIYDIKPNRFTRSSEIMKTVNKICNEVGCDEYPAMSLVSYLILEARYSGAW